MGFRFLKGVVYHGRYGRIKNTFNYRQSYVELALEDIEKSTTLPWWFGVNRFSLLSFYHKDHGDRDGADLRAWIIKTLHQVGLKSHWFKTATLITHPRIFGFVFNPVSFWYLKDENRKVRCIFAEVNNTFSQTHTYVLARQGLQEIPNNFEFFGDKCFHVSPFYEVKGVYRFVFKRSKDYFSSVIDYANSLSAKPHFRATLKGNFEVFTFKTAVKHLLIIPLGAFKTVFFINVQALKLFIKGVTFKCSPKHKNHTVSLILEG